MKEELTHLQRIGSGEKPQWMSSAFHSLGSRTHWLFFERLKRFHNYCLPIKVARSGFPWENTTKASFASLDTYCEIANRDGTELRLHGSQQIYLTGPTYGQWTKPLKKARYS